VDGIILVTTHQKYQRGNRFLAIEAEPGERARFLGKDGLKVTRWP